MTNFSSNNRRALTLIEMLIGMAITLVMMAAVVNLFANISQGVRNRRATMEISANLRIARTQLFNDLAGATCLKYPKNAHGVMPKPDSNNPPDGYFEYVEGEYSDDNPYAPGSIDPTTSLVPSSSAAFDAQGNPVVVGEYTDGGGLGDYDDILAMTVENEVEKFRGKGRGLRPGGDPRTDADWIDMAISSPVAEVIWFATQNPTDRSEGEPGMRKIYRRILLVAPWYGTETKTVNISGTPTAVTDSDPMLDLVTRGFTTHEQQLLALRDFQETYDISVRLENGRLVPNTLADLAKRQNRYAHSPNDSVNSINYFPHRFPYDTGEPDICEEVNEGDSSLRRLQGERQGEDLVLTDVLGFDVQIYDPGAPLIADGPTIILEPNSPRWATLTNPGSPSLTPVGYGTYVDLYWRNLQTPWDQTPVLARWTLAASDPRQLFGDLPALKSNLIQTTADYRSVVYDTWTTYYETDQIDQDNMDGDNDILTGADEGTNGLDDPGLYDTDNDPSTPPVMLTINGPDDPGERETSPPYPYPLLGVQVKLRVYEPESRQIRETTVTRNLAK